MEPLSQDEYVREREMLWQGEHKAGEAFDKILVAVSGGALTLSVTFVKDIAPHPPLWGRYVLVCAWICFALCLLVTVLMHLYNQVAFTYQREEWDRCYKEDKDPSTIDNRFTKRVRKLNWAAVVILGLGLVSLLLFATSSLYP